MHGLTTVNRKYVTKMTNLSNPPLLEMSEIALPTPLKIDAPECVFSTVGWRLQGVMPEKNSVHSSTKPRLIMDRRKSVCAQPSAERLLGLCSLPDERLILAHAGVPEKC